MVVPGLLVSKCRSPDDSIVEPGDALAMVLAMTICAYSMALGGRSAQLCPDTKAASSPATVTERA